MRIKELPDDFRTMGVTSDPGLSPEEKATSIVISNDKEHATIHSDVTTTIKWILSIEASEVEWIRTHEGQICACKAKIPKGIIRLKASPRKSNSHSHMVAYGDLR